jgi:hypothetical protein
MRVYGSRRPSTSYNNFRFRPFEVDSMSGFNPAPGTFVDPLHKKKVDFDNAFLTWGYLTDESTLDLIEWDSETTMSEADTALICHWWLLRTPVRAISPATVLTLASCLHNGPSFLSTVIKSYSYDPRSKITCWISESVRQASRSLTR